jgi:hypothetical protein
MSNTSRWIASRRAVLVHGAPLADISEEDPGMAGPSADSLYFPRRQERIRNHFLLRIVC